MSQYEEKVLSMSRNMVNWEEKNIDVTIDM